MLRRILRLVRLELRTGVTSPWYYIFVIAMAGFLVILDAVLPARERLTVLVASGAPAVATRRVASSLSRDGYRVETGLAPADAVRAVEGDRALAALRIDRTGVVEGLVRSYRLLPEARRAVSIASLRSRQGAFDAAARRARVETPRVAVEQEDGLGGVPRPGLWLAAAGARGAWIVAAFWRLALTVVVRETFSRFRRTYGAAEILVAQVISGTIAMIPTAIAGLAVPLALGMSFPRPWSAWVPVLASAAAGTLLGTFFSAIIMTRPRDERTIGACAVAIFLIYASCDAAVSGFAGEVSEAAMPPLHRLAAPLNSSYQLWVITKLAVFAPEASAAPGELARSLAFLFATALAPALGALAVLRRR